MRTIVKWIFNMKKYNTVEQQLRLLEECSSKSPDGDKEYKNWLKQIEFIHFLKGNITNDDVILYASLGDVDNYIYIYGILVPTENLNPRDDEDLLQWDCNPTRQWGMRGWSEKDWIICPPIDSPISKSLNDATQMLFLRRFGAKAENKRYIEISETLLQPHDLHYMQESNSYCTFDECGDVKQIIKIICADGEELTLVTINKDILKRHLNITRCLLVRFFESRRMPGEFNSKSKLKQKRISRDSICYNRTYFDDKQSSIRGFQIVESEDVKIKNKKTKKKYEKFVAHDWRNKKVTQLSCDPKKLASYFELSNLPFETTPVFFNGNVLTKYKSDPDKYKLTDSMLSCRSAWCLECYHINDTGQIFTYLIYLSRLPYKEQQHWKQFNEKPNGGISRSAFLSDFKGEVDLAYEPMQSIKQFLKSDIVKTGEIWKLKDPHLIDQLHYPITGVRKEWSEAIGILNKIINEGFSVAKLRQILQKNNVNYDEKWRSTNHLSASSPSSMGLYARPQPSRVSPTVPSEMSLTMNKNGH